MRQTHLVGFVTISVCEFQEARVIAEAVEQDGIQPLYLFLENLPKFVEERLEPWPFCSLSVKLVNAVGPRIRLVSEVENCLLNGGHCANMWTADVAKIVARQPALEDKW